MSPSDAKHGPSSRLNEQTVELVRTALRGYVADVADTAPLRAALVRLAAEAREREVLPEQVLVVVKDLWSAMPEVRALHDVGDQVRMQQHVVTMCIKEYYSS